MSYIVIMIIGVMIGAFIRCQKVLRFNVKLQTALVVLLLLAMGITFGARASLWQDLQAVGLHALVYTGFAGGGSVLVVFLLSKWLMKGRNK